jgi:hypothetical protein
MLTLPVKSPPSVIVLLFAHALAVVAFPLSAAVIVPAAKLPLLSRATTFDAVFVVVASTASVSPAPSLPPLPPVMYDPLCQCQEQHYLLQ